MDFKKLVKPYQNELLSAISHFVSIPSFKDKATISEATPYGKEVDHVLKEFAKLGEMFGFKVELDKRYVELSLGDKGPLIEVFGHLDVVPANQLKDRDPFKVVTKDNKIFGRGVIDDKGPLLAAFFAIKALKDNGLIKNSRIKIFAGGDEECGGSGLEYYVKEKKKEPPTYGFTPDAQFPLIYGEKGVAVITLKKKVNFKNVISINGGLATNIVMPKATFKVDNINEIKDKIKVAHEINQNEITFIGKAAHGSLPELGENAFLIGLKSLGDINHDEVMLDLYQKLIDYTGKAMNAYSNCPNLEETRYNLGIVKYENNELILKINYRYPEKPDPHELTNNVAKSLGATLVDESYSGTLFFDLKSPLVSILFDAYQKETGDTINKPLVIGGGTYAKDVKNTIAFGPSLPHKDNKEHQDEESVDIDDLMLAMSIYAHAVYSLMHPNEN